MNQRKEINSLAENINNSNCNESDSELEDNSCKENYYSIKEKSKVRQRQENSLGELTKNFINYIKEQNTKEIDINEVVKKLKVKKRRIYDITNVLEGNLLFSSFSLISKLFENNYYKEFFLMLFFESFLIKPKFFLNYIFIAKGSASC